jgi:hypothetical protein
VPRRTTAVAARAAVSFRKSRRVLHMVVYLDDWREKTFNGVPKFGL